MLDVRRPAEYATGHVPGARSVSLDSLEKDAPGLDAERSTAVICAGGYRSSAGSSLLARLGLRRLFDVVGGTTAWIQGGHPVKSGP